MQWREDNLIDAAYSNHHERWLRLQLGNADVITLVSMVALNDNFHVTTQPTNHLTHCCSSNCTPWANDARGSDQVVVVFAWHH